MNRVLSGLFSKRVKSFPKNKATDAFTERQLSDFVYLMGPYASLYVYRSHIEGYQWNNQFGGEFVYELKEQFIDSLRYAMEEEYRGSVANFGDLLNYFMSCKLASLFDTIETFGAHLNRACTLVNDFTPMQKFVEDFNTYLDNKNKEYKLVMTDRGIEVHKKTMPFAEDNIIKLFSTLAENTEFEKSEAELRKAIVHRTKGKYEDALRWSNISLETTMAVMGCKASGSESSFKITAKKYNLPQLIVDKYDHLQKIVGLIENARSKYGETHGDKEKRIIEHIEELAELAVNIIAALNIYLMRIYKKRNP